MLKHLSDHMSLLQKSILPLTLKLSTRGEGKSPLERGVGVCSPPSMGGVGEGCHIFIALCEPKAHVGSD